VKYLRFDPELVRISADKEVAEDMGEGKKKVYIRQLASVLDTVPRQP
jgi:hypothetical protein